MAFKLIKGGLDPSSSEHYSFVFAEVTNTRLMGVVVMHMMFKPESGPSVHQYYYYDYEELGLEHIKFYVGDEPEAVRDATVENCACLGGDLVQISEREARYLADFFIKDTVAKGEQLPKEAKEIAYSYEGAEELTDLEIRELNAKLCTELNTDYSVVNYYLMRCMGHDYEAADLLVLPGAKPEYISMEKHSTFLRNKITVEEDGSYRCESLVESEDRHYLVLSHLELSGRKVLKAVKDSELRISVIEASMLLKKQEYVTVYDLQCDDLEFEEFFKPISRQATQTNHLNGCMYMFFRDNNSHVDNKIFNLSDDIQYLFFYNDSDQLVVAAYSFKDILDGELKVLTGPLEDYAILTGRYRFDHPILYDFVDSEYDDFNEFVATVQEGE